MFRFFCHIILTLFGFSALMLSGCSQPSKCHEEVVMDLVEPRLNLFLNQDISNSCNDAMINRELSQDEAVQLALFHNPDIKAAFASLGIAEADLLEAGLISNPVLDGLIRFPQGKGHFTNTELSLMQNLTDILQMPLRQKAAEAEIAETELKVANFILDIAFDVQETYLRLQAKLLERDLKQKIADLSEAASLIANGQFEKGNISSIDRQTKESQSLSAKAKWMESEKEILELKKHMNQLLGLSSHQNCWSVKQNLPGLPLCDPSYEQLEELALQNRLDFAIILLEKERLKRLLHLKPWWSYLNPSIGASYEKDPEGIKVFGPSFSLALPIFNSGQADRKRLYAKLQQNRQKLISKQVEIHTEVQAAYTKMTLERNLSSAYQNQLLLLEKDKTKASERHYNVMGLSLYKLIDQRTMEYNAEIQSQLALSNYWLAKVGLDRALGGALIPSIEPLLAAKEAIPEEEKIEQPSSLKSFSKNSSQTPADLPYRPVVTPNVNTLPWKMEDGFKVFHLIAEPVKREFAPGMTVNCWGFNGEAPGPTIEAVEGDKVRIYVTNRLPEPTTIHWHGLILPNGMDGVTGITQRPILPNETFKYEFTLSQNGTFMYHPHYDEMIQIGLGMMGFFVIHPKNPIEEEKVDKDFAIMLGEWAIPIGASTPDPMVMLDFNYFTFNGKVWPGIDSLVAKKGEKVRIRLANLSMNSHPIHLHGYEFTVVRNGAKRLKPSAQYDAVTINVPPGETREIEFIANAPGDWPLHCHKTHHTMNGMQHDIPNLIGVHQDKAFERLKKILPEAMPMGSAGMGEMFDIHSRHHQTGPSNYLKLGSEGQFGVIELSGMFTLLKVREDLENDQDPSWYANPKGTVAEIAELPKP